MELEEDENNSWGDEVPAGRTAMAAKRKVVRSESEGGGSGSEDAGKWKGVGGNRRKRLKVSRAERERLEKLVLGDSSTVVRGLRGESDSGLEEGGPNAESECSDSLGSPERAPAWVDEDDEELFTVREVLNSRQTRKVPLGLRPKSDYQSHLRKRFTDVYGQPEWARLGRRTVEDLDPDLALLRSSGKLMAESKYLPKTVLEVKRLASLNCSTRNEGPIVKAVRFHPTTNVGLVAGLGGVASLIQVDGKGNNVLASVNFKKFPIRCARFTSDGNQFVVGSNAHSHFHSYDMLRGTSIRHATHHNMELSNTKLFELSSDGKFLAVVGRFGQIHLLTAASKEWVATLTMNGSVETLCFSSDNKYLYTTGDEGDVYVWNLATRTLSHKFHDEGSIKTLSLSASPCGTYLAAGSASGVVNVYDAAAALGQPHPTPLKAVMNLVTSATTVAFNHSSQILALASDEVKNSLKLVHLPSLTVFANFPSQGLDLGRVQDVAFSPTSGYLAAANNKFTAFLFRLKHFGNY